MHGARAWQAAAWVMMASLAGGCALRLPPVAPEAAAAPTVQPVTRVSTNTSVRTVAAATAPVQLLPDTTAVVVNVAGIDALLAVVEVDALVAKYRPVYDQAALFLTSHLGANLLDPGQWHLIGIDAKGPMGGALVDVRSMTFVAYATVSDPVRLRSFFDRAAGADVLMPVFEDRGLVLKVDPDRPQALVLRDGFVFFVASDQPNEAMVDFARLLATIDPARGLTASARYQQAIAGGAPAPGLSAYVDLWAALEGEVASLARPRTDPSFVEQELEMARATGAAPEVQDGLRKQVEQEHAWERRNLDRRTRKLELAKRWLGVMSPVMFEFTGSASGMVGTIRAKMPETAPLRAALRNAAEPSPVLMALGERPVMMFGGSIEVPAALAELEALLHADGEDPAQLYLELDKDLGIPDARREILELLAGTGGFALTVSDALVRGESLEGRDVGFAVGLAVSDEARAGALLERSWKHVSQRLRGTGTAAPVGKDRATGAHTLAVAGYRTIYAKVVARQLVVTTDVGVIKRIAAGTSKATHKWIAPAVVPVVSARDATMQGLLDVMLAVFLSSNQYSRDQRSEPMQPFWMFTDKTAEQLDKIPRSPAYKAELRQWQAVNAKIHKQERVQQRVQFQQVILLAQCFGVMTGNLREQPDGLVLAGGQMFGHGGLTRAIELGTDYLSQPPAFDEGLQKLREARVKHEGELQRIRVQDVATALKVPTPKL